MHRNVAEKDSHALTRKDATTKPEAEISKEKSKMKVSKKKMYLSAWNIYKELLKVINNVKIWPLNPKLTTKNII